MIDLRELRIGNLIKGEYYDLTDEDIRLYQDCKVLAIDATGFGEYSIIVDSNSLQE